MEEKRRSGSSSGEEEELARRCEGRRRAGGQAGAREWRARRKRSGVEGDPEGRRTRVSGPRAQAGGARCAPPIERLENGLACSDVRLTHARERTRSNGPNPGEARSDGGPFCHDVESAGGSPFFRELRVVILGPKRELKWPLRLSFSLALFLHFSLSIKRVDFRIKQWNNVTCTFFSLG